MRRIPGYRLWLGHAGDARDAVGILDRGIRAVVDLALEEPPSALTRDLIYCRFPLMDGAGNPAWILRAAVETVAELLRSGVPTLVCCGAGLSRAPCIAGTAIALVRGCSLADGLAVACEGARGDVSPALWAAVQDCAVKGAIRP